MWNPKGVTAAGEYLNHEPSLLHGPGWLESLAVAFMLLFLFTSLSSGQETQLFYHTANIGGTSSFATNYAYLVRFTLPDPTNTYEVTKLSIASDGVTNTPVFANNTIIALRIFDSNQVPIYTSASIDMSGLDSSLAWRQYDMSSDHVRVKGSFYGGYEQRGAGFTFRFKFDAPTGSQYGRSHSYRVTTGAWSTKTEDHMIDAYVQAVEGSPGQFRFGSAAYGTGESDAALTVEVSRVNGSDGSATVQYATTDGTATAGADYAATSGTLAFGAGETSKTFAVTLLDDSIRESDETVGLQLFNPTGGATLSSPTSAVLTIVDNDRCLVVASPWGIAVPAVGTNVFAAGTIQTCGILNSPVTGGTTQYMCKGWVGTGSVPATGGTTNTGSFALTNDSMIGWQWATNYWLGLATNGNGSVQGSNGWYALAGSVTVTAVPSIYYHFDAWSGDVPPDHTKSNPLTLTMDRPRAIMAGFAANMATNGTPHWWLALHGLPTNDAAAFYDDGDGMPAWEEYIAGTVPTNADSVLRCEGGETESGTHGAVLRWHSVSGRAYVVEVATNLLSTGFEPLTSWLPATPTVNVWTDSVPDVEPRFYRIGVTNGP